jgi:hypothetical protein
MSRYSGHSDSSSARTLISLMSIVSTPFSRAGLRPASRIARQGRGLATFSPPLNAVGNSVRRQLVTKYMAERLGLNLFASVPANDWATVFAS